MRCLEENKKENITSPGECEKKTKLNIQKLREEVKVQRLSSDKVKADIESFLIEDFMYSFRLSRDIISEWNKNNSRNITKINDLSLAEILKLLILMQAKKPNSQKLSKTIKNLNITIKVITSVKFSTLYDNIKRNFPDSLSPSSFYGIYKNNPSLTIDDSFWGFSRKIALEFGIKRKEFHSEISLYKILIQKKELQKSLKKNYKVVKQFFPNIPNTNVFLVELLDIIKQPNHKIAHWREWRDRFDKLISIYPRSFLKIDSVYDWKTLFLHLKNEPKVRKLVSHLAIEVWGVLKKYPKVLKDIGENINTILSDTGALQSRIIPFFQGIEAKPTDFEYLLKLGGLDINDVALYPSSSQRIPKEIGDLLRGNTFKKAIEKLFNTSPHIKEKITFEDWLDIVKSFLMNGNLDDITKINVLYKEAGIKEIDLRSNHSKAKIAFLKQLIHLNIPTRQFRWSCGKNKDICTRNSTDWSFYIIKSGEALNSSEIRNSISHKDFPTFAKKTAKYFPQTNWETDIPDIALLFRYVQEHPKYKEVLFSKRFHELCDFLVNKVEFVEAKLLRSEKVNKVPIRSIQEILPLLKEFPFVRFEKIVSLLKEDKEKVVANDILLIIEIARSSTPFKNILEDRGITAREITKKLGKGVRRSRFGDLEYYLKRAKKNKNTKEKKEVQFIIDNYNERPDITTLPSLDILRLKNIQTALSSRSFLQDLGKIVHADLQDSVELEHGGIITLKYGRVKLHEIKTNSTVKGEKEENASYENYNYEPMHGGILQFHLHATSVNASDFAGPSGYKGMGGDFALVGYRNAPGIIFTPVGHPKDASGVDIKNKILINIDYYFVDKNFSTPKDYKQIVLDLGVVEVSLKK